VYKILFEIKNKMKKTLLWIWIPSVLVIAVAGFVFFNMRDWEPNQNIIENVKPEQDIQSNQEIIDENIWRTYLSAEECYNEYWVLNENPNTDDNWNIINCYNGQGEQQGKWVTYKKTRFWKFKNEENYKNWKRDWEYIQYYENWTISLLENYKDWELDWKSISYDEDWEKVRDHTYVNWKKEWEQLDYHKGDWWLKMIYKNWEIVDIQENSEASKKLDEYLENHYLIREWLWENFESWLVLGVEDFKNLTDSIYSDYNIYYDEEWRYLFEDMYREEYEDKSWELLALYSMMNCSEDPSNPDTYLFNLDDPKLAQEIYFKNCPKWCRYSDEEDIDFICE